METTITPTKFKVAVTKGLIKVQFELEHPSDEIAAALVLLGLQFDTQVTMLSRQIALPTLIHTPTFDESVIESPEDA